MAHDQGKAVRVTDVLTTFWCPLWSITKQSTATWNLFVLYNKELRYAEESFNDDVIYMSIFAEVIEMLVPMQEPSMWPVQSCAMR